MKVNLFYMRRFFLAFPKVHTLCKQLNWSHYRTLIAVEDSKARQFYFEECAKSGWSVRDLQRQISTHFYERLVRNHVDLRKASALVKKTEVQPKDIVLGSERNEAVIRYTLNDHERNLFAVKYHLDLPTDEELCLELQRERAAIEEALLLKGKRSSRGSSTCTRS